MSVHGILVGGPVGGWCTVWTNRDDKEGIMTIKMAKVRVNINTNSGRA
jgi:hypothetical protein